MSQTFPAVSAATQLVDSRQKFVDRDEALRTLFSGTAFPAEASLYQLCFRTDESKLYICTNATGPVFTEFFSFLLQYLTGGGTNDRLLTRISGVFAFTQLNVGMVPDDIITYAKMQNVSAQNRIMARYSSGAGDMEEATLGTGFSFSGGALTINVATALGYTPLNAASYTAADVLAKLLTVDGASSGIDADLLDGANLSIDGTFAGNSDALIPSQKAVKTYVDNALTGLRWKPSVRVATTAAGTLATSFENGDTVDGVVLATGDRILIKNQSAGAENGIYVVAASGAPTRATDMDTSAEALQATCFVQEGTTNADTQWTCTTGSITLGTTALVFAQVSGAGTYTASGGVTLTGNAFSITANGITNAMIRQGAALSVMGVAGNATANVADIAAGTTGHVLRRSGTTLAFGTLEAGAFASNTIPLTALANVSANRILGSIAGGAVSELSAANVKTILALAQADISGLTTADTPLFTGVNIGNADTTLSRIASGILGIEGVPVARVASGSAANTGRISWGTAAPGTLAEGEIYLKYT